MQTQPTRTKLSTVFVATSFVMVSLAVLAPTTSASRYEWRAEPPFVINEYCGNDPCNVDMSQDPENGVFHAEATLGPSPNVQDAHFSAWTTVETVLRESVPWVETSMRVRFDADLANAPDNGSATAMLRYHYTANTVDHWCGDCYVHLYDTFAGIGQDPCSYCEELPSSFHEERTISGVMMDRWGDIPAGKLQFWFDLEAYARTEPAGWEGHDYWMELEANETSGHGSGFGDPTEDPLNFYLNVSAAGQNVEHDGADRDPPPPSQPMVSFNVTMTILEFKVKIPKPGETPRLPPGHDRNYTVEWTPPLPDGTGVIGLSCEAEEPEECSVDPSSGAMALDIDTGSSTLETSDTGNVAFQIPMSVGAAESVLAEVTIDLSNAAGHVEEVFGSNSAYAQALLSVRNDACYCSGLSYIGLMEAGSGTGLPGSHPSQRGPETIVLRVPMYHQFPVMPPGNLTVEVGVRADTVVDIEDWGLVPAGLSYATATMDLTVTNVRLHINPSPWAEPG